MANWSSSIFGLIGSGLTLFVITNAVSDFNQPNINIRVDQSAIGDNQIISKIFAINDGRVAATHVLLTAFYPAAKIINYSSPFHSENIILLQQKPNLLVAKIDRLAKDATIDVNTMLAASMNKGLGFNNSYIVSASYDQGSNTISSSTLLNSPLLNADNPTIVPGRIQILVFVSALSALFFIMSISYKRISNFIKNLERSTYVLSIIREMALIQNEIKNDLLSKRIFTTKIWESKDDHVRRQVFSDYEDYNKIDEFYVELKKRDSILSQKNTSGDLIKKCNRICLWLVICVLRNIDWTRYLDIGHKRTRLVLAILAAILSSCLIFSINELFRINFFSFHIFSVHIIYGIFSFIIRSIVTFFLAVEIINFYWSYNYEVDHVKNDIVLNITIPKYGLKLFIFTILIMGVSWWSYFIRPIDLIRHIESNSNFAYEFFTLILISDIARMLILIFIVPKFLIKGNIIKIKEIVQYDNNTTTIGENNFGHNEEQQEKQQQRQPHLQQHFSQREDHSYNHNNEELGRIKQVDADNDKKQTFKLVDTLDELERLANLRKNGIITEEEFQMLKTRLFGKI